MTSGTRSTAADGANAVVPGLGTALLAAALLALTLFVFNPASVYQNNVHEFSTSLTGLLRSAWPWALAAFAGYATLLFVLRRWVRWFAAALAVVLLVWLQSNLLSFSYGKLDGSGLDFEPNRWRSLYEIPLWLAAIGFALLRPRPIVANAAFVCGLLIAAQTVLALTTLPERSEAAASLQSREIPPRYFDYGGGTNVLHIVLDEFGSGLFDAVLEQHPEYADAFRGFTFYRDATGLFPTTNVSMHAILTGELYDYSEPLADQIARDLPRAGIAARLMESGYDAQLVGKYFLCRRMGYECRIVPGTSAEQAATNASLRLLDYGLFRAGPHLIKAALFDSSAQFLQSRFAVGDARMRTLPYQAVAFLRRAIAQLRADSALPPQYNYYHVALPHLPAVTNAECEFVGRQPFERASFMRQAVCATRLTAQLLEAMREAGVLESSLIVIHSDHGSWFDIQKVPETGPERPSAWDMSRSSALLLVKLPGASQPLQISDAPASLADVRPSILDALGLPDDTKETGGVPLKTLTEEQTRTRRYWGFEWKGVLAERDYLPVSREFSIRGSHWEQSNWQFAGTSSGTCRYALGQVVEFKANARLPFCVSIGLSAAEQQHTWTNGDRLALEFDIDLANYAGNGMTLSLRSGAFVPDGTPIQAALSVNGTLLQQATFDSQAMRELSIDVPHELVRAQMELQVAIKSPRRPVDLGINADPRNLGLRLYRLVLNNAPASN
ncbi:MAG: sulfatase-like hydrolase/transferase [Pseudomonadota bacterium]